MKPIDILYTPLDVPPLPNVDIEALMAWVHAYSTVQRNQIHGTNDASKVVDDTHYPWDIMYVKNKGTWCQNFDIAFPELADHFSSAFGLNPDQLTTIIILPVKNDFVGTGFFHADNDECGLRMYIENQEDEDFLLIRPTIDARMSRPTERVVMAPFGPWPHIQEKEYSAKLLHSKQAFFLNNIRAVHAAKCNKKNALRIAVVIGFYPNTIDSLPENVQKLIVESAEKFPEHTIYWQAP